MPRLSDSMEEGTILRWLKSVGRRGRASATSWSRSRPTRRTWSTRRDAAGTLIEIVAAGGRHAADRRGDRAGRARPGEAVRPSDGAGRPMARAPDAEPASPATPSPPPPRGAAASRPRGSPRRPPAAATAGGDGRVKASPLARRIAEENGLDLAALAGSGPGGRIVKADVERAIAAGAGRRARRAAAAPPAAPAEPTPGARERPETAKGAGPERGADQAPADRRPADGRVEGDRAALLPAGRGRHEPLRSRRGRESRRPPAEGDVVPSFNDMVVKACAIALREYPRANGAYRDGRLELYSRVNVGRRGRRPGRAGRADGLRRRPQGPAADRVRDPGAGRSASATATITPPELSGGTFTVSNLGMFGISSFAAGDQPAAGGDPRRRGDREQPVVRDGEITTAHLMALNLACDHRILYGADGARFLDRIRAPARGAARAGALRAPGAKGESKRASAARWAEFVVHRPRIRPTSGL